MNTFPTAAEARAGSRNNLAVHSEIRWLEKRIYESIEAGRLSVDVSDSPFTDPQLPTSLSYYGAIFADSRDRSLREQIDIVQKNFYDIGYQICPLRNLSNGTTFIWRILW